MPPDRTPSSATTPSFLEALQSGAPLSSHGIKHAPSLPRGSSCTTCRSRKIRCDAVRPCCGACRKSAEAHNEDPSTIVCTYVVPAKRAKKPNKVAELEAKLARLEQKLGATGGSISPSANLDSPASSSVAGPSYSMLEDQATPQQDTDQMMLDDASSIPVDGYLASEQSPFGHGFPRDPVASTSSAVRTSQMPPSSSTSFLNAMDNPAPVESESQPVASTSAIDPLAEYGFRQNIPTLSSTTYSLPSDFPRSRITVLSPLGWPSSLPSPPLVHRLIDVFFSKSHLATDLMVESKFRSALALPPSHPKFPLTALLHGMLAIAGRMVSPDWFLDEPKRWGLDDPDESFADHHANKADAMIDEAFSKASNQRIRVAQAAGLVCFSFYTAGKFAKVWLQVARLTRIIVGLGLNHVRAATRGKDGVLRDRSLHMKQSVLPPTDDREDLYERAAACQMAFLADKISTASTTWACSLDEGEETATWLGAADVKTDHCMAIVSTADITTLIPPPHGVAYPNKDLDTSPLSSWNANFFVHHPSDQVGPFQLYFKTFYLLGRVTTFLSRAPYPIGMSLARTKTDGSKLTVSDIKNSETFRRLEMTIRQFQQSVPREIQNVYTLPNADSRLALIFAIPHICLIMLHEPFATVVEGDESFEKCISSARAILSSVYTLYGSSFEIGGLAPFISYCYAATGRTLVREIAIRKLRGLDSTHIYEEMQTILIVLDEFHTPLGATTAETLRALMAMPELCLPHRPRYAKEDDLDTSDEPLGHPVFASPYKLPARLGKVPLNAWVGPGYSDASKPSAIWHQSIPSWSVQPGLLPNDFASMTSPQLNAVIESFDAMTQPPASASSQASPAAAQQVDYLEALLQSEAVQPPSKRAGRGWTEKHKDEYVKNSNRFSEVLPPPTGGPGLGSGEEARNGSPAGSGSVTGL